MRFFKNRSRGGWIIKILSSPRLALFDLISLSLFTGISSWLPWVVEKDVEPPFWAKVIGLDHPFYSIPFLVLVIILFLNTAACTIKRTGKTINSFKGICPHGAVEFQVISEPDFIEFLRLRGFSTDGDLLYFKNRYGLLKGLPLHIGLVLLISGVLIEQSFHESGAFQIAVKEGVHLPEQGTVFNHFAGPLAKKSPPDIVIVLEYFDPFHYQKGYAPDRYSKLSIMTDMEHEEKTFVLDRAKGIDYEGISIYQAIPFGIALYVEIENMGMRTFHLQERADGLLYGEFINPAGKKTIFYVETQRKLSDPLGTGKLKIFIEQDGNKKYLDINTPFLFGNTSARVVSADYWAGFTYSRSSGKFLVFLGFAIVVLGAFLLIIPAGIARKDGSRWQVYLTRGTKEFIIEARNLGLIK